MRVKNTCLKMGKPMMVVNSPADFRQMNGWIWGETRL